MTVPSAAANNAAHTLAHLGRWFRVWRRSGIRHLLGLRYRVRRFMLRRGNFFSFDGVCNSVLDF